MATATDNTEAREIVQVPQASMPEVLDAIVKGDLSKLTVTQRTQYFQARCAIAGLDWRTRPFDWISLQGKLILYANKECAAGLIALHKLKVEVADSFLFESSEREMFRVKARVTFPDGRCVEDIGTVATAHLNAKDLENACMKATTKAKRRCVLSACGLGMLDESELEGLQTAPATTNLGLEYQDVPGRDQIEFNKWLTERIDAINAKWLDKWTGKDGQIPEGIKELVGTYQLKGHLIKWAVVNGWLTEKPDVNNAGRDKILTRIWMDHWAEMRTETRDYAVHLAAEQQDKLSAQGDVPKDDVDDEAEMFGGGTGNRE